MKRSLVVLVAACCALYSGLSSAASEVPDTSTGGSPTLTVFNDVLYLAWMGVAPVGALAESWYATYDGTWSAVSEIPGSYTSAPPVLAVADQVLYMATTPPNTQEIDIYQLGSSGFSLQGPLCEGVTCAQTEASPALAGNSTTLFAAWTTPTGSIMYAQFTDGAWSIAPNPIPNASANPATGPTLATYQNQLYLAWTDASGGAISAVSTALPLTTTSFSNPMVQVPAQTSTAPALGVFTVIDSAPSQSLFLAWTTGNLGISFAEQDSQTGAWSPVNSPIDLPSGALSGVAPALTASVVETPNDACIFTNYLAYTALRPAGSIKFGKQRSFTKHNLSGCP